MSTLLLLTNALQVDRRHDVAHLQGLGVAQFHRLKVGGVLQLEHGDIRA